MDIVHSLHQVLIVILYIELYVSSLILCNLSASVLIISKDPMSTFVLILTNHVFYVVLRISSSSSSVDLLVAGYTMCQPHEL